MAAGEREQGRAPAGRSGLDRFRYEYGAQPLHLLATGASLLLCGYGLLRINDLNDTVRILIWIGAAALLHDLVALPLYSLLLRIAHGSAGRAIQTRAMMLHALNHVRVPIGLSRCSCCWSTRRSSCGSPPTSTWRRPASGSTPI